MFAGLCFGGMLNRPGVAAGAAGAFGTAAALSYAAGGRLVPPISEQRAHAAHHGNPQQK